MEISNNLFIPVGKMCVDYKRFKRFRTEFSLQYSPSVLALPPALVPCSVDDPLHAGRVKKVEVLETERRMLVLLLVMASWKVILGCEQEEMVDKVDVALAIIFFIIHPAREASRPEGPAH